MAALSITNPTLLDLAKASDPDGKIAPVIEILHEVNEVLLDATYIEGNLVTGHRSTIRTGLPTPTWRSLNAGVQPTKGLTAQVEFHTGSMEAYAEIDKKLADLNNNSAAWRLQQERAFIEGMNQELATTLMYGNEGTLPASFTGLSPYYNLSTASNGENLIKAGGSSTDNASIWLVVWSPLTIHGIVPKGSKAGLQITDKGQVTIENADGNGGRMEAYRTHYSLDAGLVVADWRYAVRICNIAKSALKIDRSAGADLPDLMYQAMEQIPNLALGRPAFYMSRSIRSMLRRQIANGVKQSTLTAEMVGGKMFMAFDGIPLRRVDALNADEALVS